MLIIRKSHLQVELTDPNSKVFARLVEYLSQLPTPSSPFHAPPDEPQVALVESLLLSGVALKMPDPRDYRHSYCEGSE